MYCVYCLDILQLKNSECVWHLASMSQQTSAPSHVDSFHTFIWFDSKINDNNVFTPTHTGLQASDDVCILCQMVQPKQQITLLRLLCSQSESILGSIFMVVSWSSFKTRARGTNSRGTTSVCHRRRPVLWSHESVQCWNLKEKQTSCDCTWPYWLVSTAEGTAGCQKRESPRLSQVPSKTLKLKSSYIQDAILSNYTYLKGKKKNQDNQNSNSKNSKEEKKNSSSTTKQENRLKSKYMVLTWAQSHVSNLNKLRKREAHMPIHQLSR